MISRDATGTLRRLVIGLCSAAAVVVTWQRGRAGHWHSTLRIFRQSFWHLLAGANLYARYPAEQGRAPADLFKYSPTAALLFAPVAVPPYPVALLGWSLLNALLLAWALMRLLPGPRGVLAALLVLPELFVSMQAVSSNGLVAALIVLAFVALEHEHRVRAAAAIALAAAMKLYPLAALSFALFHRGRRHFALRCAAVGIVALLLPLLVTSPGTLLQQYRWWRAIELSDARDLAFGESVMALVRGWIGGDWPNWPVQALGTLVLLLPLALRRGQWADVDHRRRYLASLLGYALLFNHQAERPSFVVGAAGVAIWCVTPPDADRPPRARLLLAALPLAGLKTLPLLVVWLIMQLELFGLSLRGISTPADRARSPGSLRPSVTAIP